MNLNIAQLNQLHLSVMDYLYIVDTEWKWIINIKLLNYYHLMNQIE